MAEGLSLPKKMQQAASTIEALRENGGFLTNTSTVAVEIAGYDPESGIAVVLSPILGSSDEINSSVIIYRTGDLGFVDISRRIGRPRAEDVMREPDTRHSVRVNEAGQIVSSPAGNIPAETIVGLLDSRLAVVRRSVHPALAS